jgi:uncharacterized membrane protein (Fun14 family)
MLESLEIIKASPIDIQQLKQETVRVIGCSAVLGQVIGYARRFALRCELLQSYRLNRMARH